MDVVEIQNSEAGFGGNRTRPELLQIHAPHWRGAYRRYVVLGDVHNMLACWSGVKCAEGLQIKGGHRNG